MKITLVISHMLSGGAQRVMANMANYWAAKQWGVTLITCDDGTNPSFYALDSRIHHLAIELPGNPTRSRFVAARHFLMSLYVLRRALIQSKPDIVISFLDETNVRSLFAAIGLGVPVIVEEHNDLTQYAIQRQWAVLRLLSYAWARRVVVLNQSSRSFFPRWIRKRCVIIPNAVVVSQSINTTQASDRCHKQIIAAGRLVYQKGFERLLKAFSLIVQEFPEWKLEIWGEGPERSRLEALLQELGLNGRVRLPGPATDLFTCFRETDLFVLSSRYEGFPMVVCEALACGLPVVSFDCPSGPSKIIRDGVDGLLVPADDIEALARAMAQLMRDPERRNQMAARAPEVLERFGIEQIMGVWEQLIEEAQRDTTRSALKSWLSSRTKLVG